MWLHISGGQIYDLGTFTSGIVTGWVGRHSRHRWHRLWSRLSASVGCRCACFVGSPACLRILRGATLARKGSCRVVLTKHSQVSSYHSLHCFMPRKVNTPLVLFLDLSAMFVDQILRFLYCGVRKAFFGHFGHIQGQAHVRLFQLYPPCLPCHGSRHVENVQQISCCLEQWDWAITSTIYSSVASCDVITACFIHSWGWLSGYSSAIIPEQTT